MTMDQFSYALTNPLSQLLNKYPNEFQRSDLLKIIEEKRIERITLHYIALDGRLKELNLPIPDRRRAEVILSQGERVDGSSLFKGMVESSLSDLYVVPDYKSAFLNPFDEDSLNFICRYFTKEGERARFAPDTILHNACVLFKQNTGLDLFALGELEFYLIFDKEKTLFSLESQKGYHESSPFIKSGRILKEILRHITQITSAVKYAHSEVGHIGKLESDLDEINGKQAEQLEVEFLPRPVEEMADALVVARWLIRNIAYRNGCSVTFAPKLETGIAGNGYHFHLQLNKNGRNIMRRADGRLSGEAERLVGGLCEYADSLTAFGNTVASSYFRLVPDQEAPTRIFWSGLNRDALIRVPLAWSDKQDLSRKVNPQESTRLEDWEDSKTIELRSPDGSALVHLLLAGITMAADWGFQHDEAAAIAEKLYVKGTSWSDDKRREFKSLPASCAESALVLEKKRHLYERDNIFPPPVIEYMKYFLNKENVDFSSLKRPEEIRKILHRDIHRH
jgi:glutamine synthetase